jgi:hypothetical protein
VFEPPISEDYNTGETPPLELQLGDLFRNTVDEIGGTQLTGAPPVGTQPTQEQQHTMMADFHDMAQHAGKALAATSSVEAEARLTGGGPSHVDRLLQTLQPEGACLVWIGYSTGSNRRGGAVSSGSGAPLATLPPRADSRRTRSPSTRPLTYPTHDTRVAQRAAAAVKRKEHQVKDRLGDQRGGVNGSR